MSMRWDIKVDIESRTLKISGELTIFSVASARESLLEAMAQTDELTVDLAGVTELDSAGLQLMLLAKRKQGKVVHFRDHPDAVLRLIKLARVEPTLGDPLVLRAW
jgi:anti-sigma B factor antagonist